MTELTARRSLHVELYYHVLSFLDLGRDAASLYRARSGRPPAWVDTLLDAYRRAPGRLYAHVLPMYCDDLDSLTRLLVTGSIPGLTDVAGRRLCSRIAAAIDAERGGVEARWSDDDVEPIRAYLDDHMMPLRDALWRRAGRDAPGLHVEACDALTTGPHSHARATARGGTRRVAVSFRPAREQILCQVLHEEIHPVTDGPIRSRHTASQDTRAGSAGYALHAELERAAVDRGQELIDELAPDLTPAYAIWRARFGM